MSELLANRATPTPTPTPCVLGGGPATTTIPAKSAMDKGELQSDCVPTPTPLPAGAKPVQLLPRYRLAPNLTDWEREMIYYNLRNNFRTKAKVFVKDIPEYIREEDLWEKFSVFGRLTRLKLLRDPATTPTPIPMFYIPPRGKSRGCAEVSFVEFDDAVKAVEALNGFKSEDDHTKEWKLEIVTDAKKTLNSLPADSMDTEDVSHPKGDQTSTARKGEAAEPI